MAYPATPDFGVAAPDPFDPPAWWSFTRPDGTVNVCATTGAALVRAARLSVGLPAGTRWDAAFAANLRGRAETLAASQDPAAWAGLVAALGASAAARRPDVTALRFAIWLAYYASAGLRLDAIRVPAGARVPAWDSDLSAGPGGDALVCFDPAVDPPPGVLTDAQLAAAIDETRDGVRVHAGESFPTLRGPAVASAGGLDTTTLLLVGAAGVAAVLLVGALASARAQPATLPRANPVRVRRSRRRRAP